VTPAPISATSSEVALLEARELVNKVTAMSLVVGLLADEIARELSKRRHFPAVRTSYRLTKFGRVAQTRSFGTVVAAPAN
jgi:hypothetical protein